MRWYHEHLRVPISYWLLSVPVVLILGAEVFVGFSTLVAILVYAVFIAVVCGFLLAWSAVQVEVTDHVLRAGRETLPLSAIDEALALDEKQSALLRGPKADPAAHLLLRPYLKHCVYIKLADPTAGAPYWLIATRRPAELAAAITLSRESVG